MEKQSYKNALKNYEKYLTSNYVQSEVADDIFKSINAIEYKLLKEKMVNESTGLDAKDASLLLEYISYLKTVYFKGKLAQKSIKAVNLS